MSSSRITLFGALEVAHGQTAPQRPPTQKVLSLLGYLIAHHDVPQGRDKLVDLLWPDLMPRQGRRMLSDALWRARRLLTLPDANDTPLLDISGNAVAFRPNAETFVDLIAFERLLGPLAASFDEPFASAPDDESISQMREAVALYRGDLLEDCYDDWTLYERERLRERYLGALRRLLAHDMLTQAHDAALQTALRLVHADPLREEAHRDLMRLYYLLGRETDALRSYEQCRKILDEELGIEPDPATTSLYEEIRALQQRRAWERERLATPSGSGAAALLPEPPLVGRQEQRATLMDAIELAIAGAGGMLLVAGEAGQGKSRLLREVAAGATWRGAQISWGRGREDAQALPFGALRDALAAAIKPGQVRQLANYMPSYSLGTLARLLPELSEALPAEALHIPQPSEHQVATLHAAIVDTLLALSQLAPQVILLEDMHWFDQATLGAMAAILPGLRDARVLLVVSGRADELPRRPDVWNTLLQLDRSGLLQRIDLRGLNEQECADLVRRGLRMRQPAPRFSARLHQATGGNPFFILQALRTLQEQGILHRDAQGIWHTPWDGRDTDYSDLPLPAGLHDAIDARLRGLGPSERQALAAAAVLGQNFAPTTWAGMTTDDRRPTTDEPNLPAVVGGQWSVVVGQLLKRQFLVEDGAGYRFGHETLREVIYNDLDETTRRTLHMRAADTLEREHFARVEALAQHLYLASVWDKALPYLVQAGDRARAVYAWQDALRCYDQAIEAAARIGAELIDLATRWEIQLKRGEVATLLGDYPTAIAAYQAALALIDQDAQTPDGSVRAATRSGAQIQTLNNLTYIYGLRNEYAHAQVAMQQATALAGASPRLIDKAEVVYQAGLISFRMDDYAEARRLMAEALKHYSVLGLNVEQAKCFSIIGWSHLRQDGPVDQVIEYHRKALDLYHREDDRLGKYLCLVDLANAYLMRGQLVEVVQEVNQCLPFFRSAGVQDSVSECLFLQGEAYRRMERLDTALESLQEAHTICLRLHRNAAAAFNQVAISATLRDMGCYSEALAELVAPLQIDDRMIRARALLILSDIWRVKGDISRTWSYLTEAALLARALGSKAYLGIVYRQIAQLREIDAHGQLGAPSNEAPDIRASFAEGIRLLQEAHCYDELARTWQIYGRYLLDNRCYDEAREALTQAQTLMRQCGMNVRLAAVQQQLQSLQTLPTALRPGQRQVLLARKGVPRGRPLRPDEMIEVVWTVELPEPGKHEAANKAVARQEQLRRLCQEADAQGAEPTVGDLASALGVTARTVDRDIATLRAAGAVLMTRGSSG